MTQKYLDKKELTYRLQSFGISFDEARIFILLSFLGEQDATNISRMMGVARSAVYPVVKALEEKGLVEVTGGAVKSYSSRPLAPFLNANIQKTREKLSHLSRQRAFLDDAFRNTPETQVESQFQSIEQTALLAQVIKRMAEESQGEIFILLNGDLSSHVGESFELADTKPQARGVKLRILTHLKPGNVHLVKEYWPEGSVMHTELEPAVSIVLRDAKEALLVKPVPEVVDFVYIRNYGLLTDDAAVVETLHGLVHREWGRAITLEKWEKDNC